MTTALAIRRSTILADARGGALSRLPHLSDGQIALVSVGATDASVIVESPESVATRAARTKEMAVMAGIGAIIGGLAAKIVAGGALGPFAIGVGTGALLGAGLDEVYNVMIKKQGW